MMRQRVEGSNRRALELRDPALWALGAAMLYVATAAIYFAEQYHYDVVDDAYIAFQYAKNWALGHGLVFNPGERVEGYTNFLWIALLTPLYALMRATGGDFTGAVIFLDIAIALADLALLYALCRRQLERDWLAITVVLVLCALDNSYQAYAMSGMENHLLIGLVLAAFWTWQRAGPRCWLWVGLLLALATMTRPDGALLGACFVVAVGGGAAGSAGWRDSLGRRELVRRVGLAAGVWLLVYGCYFAARYAYYDTLLPNTFYLKVSGSLGAVARGIRYLRSFLADRYYLPAIAVMTLSWARAPLVRWALSYALAHVAYVVYVGGDFYAGHRFLVVLLPVGYLLVGEVVHRTLLAARGSTVWQHLQRRPARATAVIAVTAAAYTTVACGFAARGYRRGHYTVEILGWSERVDNNVRYMKWLGRTAPAGASMVLGDIGAAGFFANLRVIDVFGVVDPVIAHQPATNYGHGKPGHEKRGSDSYLLRSKPTYVKWGYIHRDLHSRGYFIFTDFPAGLKVPGLWVREDHAVGGVLANTRIRFTPAELRSWHAEGSAFRHLPTRQLVPGQLMVQGQQGPYINTFTRQLGDAATGVLRSAPIDLVGDQLLLRVGGGRDPERLRVSLLVDGQRVRSATGHGFDILGRRRWDITQWRGRQAIVEIVDQSTAPWGHLLVDELRQWRAPAP